MPLNLLFKNKTPFRHIDGQAYCIWQYQITLDQQSEGIVARVGGLLNQLGLGGGDKPDGAGIGGEVGMALSGRLDIKDPSLYDNVSELKGTRLDKSANKGMQYIYKKAPQADIGTLNISFVASCEEDLFTPISLSTLDPHGNRQSPAFRVAPDGMDNVSQTTRGPAVTGNRAQTDDTQVLREAVKILPYSSELFGVYQPLIGWRSALSHSRLADATAQRFVAATHLIHNATNLSAEEPIGKLHMQVASNRTGSLIGQRLASEVSDRNPAGVRTNEWQALLANSELSALSSITKKVISEFKQRVPETTKQAMTKTNVPLATDRTMDASPPNQMHNEAATATLLHYLGQTAPQVVAQMFRPAQAPWQKALAGALWFADNHPAKMAFLSPIGILHRFREFFFELGSFLGPPVGHIWLSPGGSVELVEVNTRRALVERTVEQSTETVQKTELSTTDKDELSDAVKNENANDTKLGVTATASGGVQGVWQASGSASFNLDTSRKEAQEQTHKRMREQSSKLSSEVRQNYKTTFRTVTETTDTSSRRYVLQNTTDRLVSYELSRKMRKVAVQVQDLGRQLCWQLYIDNPGNTVGLGEFVHTHSSALEPGVKRPDTIPDPKPQEKTFSSTVSFIQTRGGDDDNDLTYVTSADNRDKGIDETVAGENNIIEFKFDFNLPPPPDGCVVSQIRAIDFHGAQVEFSINDLGTNPDPVKNSFSFRLTHANFGGAKALPFDAMIVYEPTQAGRDAIAAANAKVEAAYNDEVAVQKEQKFYETLRKRLKLVGQVKPRPADDLREEERSIIFRAIITRLYGAEARWTRDDYHVASEMIRYLFDVDSMLYFVAPDWWLPRAQKLVSRGAQGEIQPTIIADSPLSEHMGRIGRVPRMGTFRPNYLITEETAPAPLGASLGWLIQLDGDRHRNAFLNSPWVKAVLPIRLGRERDAFAWLRRPEVADGDGLDEPYPFDAKQDPPEYRGLTLQEVLLKIAGRISEENQASLVPVPVELAAGDQPVVNQEVSLPTEMVFSRGFDPLEGGIKFGEKPFKVFTQWTEILPTDQVVATEYSLKGLNG